MNVRVTLNKMNSGRMQVACVRSSGQLGGSGTGAVRTFAADANEELRKFLGALGIGNDVVAEAMSSLSKIGPYEVLTVAELDVPKEVLQANGFFGV